MWLLIYNSFFFFPSFPFYKPAKIYYLILYSMLTSSYLFIYLLLKSNHSAQYLPRTSCDKLHTSRDGTHACELNYEEPRINHNNLVSSSPSDRVECSKFAEMWSTKSIIGVSCAGRPGG
jgi:hypothetical protein